MKKLWWLLALFIIATAVKDGLDRLGPVAEAYRVYREQATAGAVAKSAEPPFRDIEGSFHDVTYTLESGELQSDGRVKLVVVEAIQFQKLSESGPFGNRRIAQTRQTVLMAQVNGEWVVSELAEEATEVRSLDSVALPGEGGP